MYTELTSIMFRTKHRAILAVSVLLLCLHPSLAQSTEQEKIRLTFGLYTTDKPTVLVKTFRPILSAIEKDLSVKLGKPVDIKLQISGSYESGVAALVNGDVDFSRFGPASYLSAKEQNPELRILALDSKNNTKTTQGVIAVKESSPYTSMCDLRGTRFAFGNRASTIGRYLSQAYLFKHGIGSQDLSNFNYLDRHDRVGHAVAQGSFDAGALKQSTFKKLKAKGLPLRALATFDNVNKPWIARAGMQEEIFQALRTVMFELDAPQAFKALGQKRFVPGFDKDFVGIRNAINRNDDFFYKKIPLNTATTDVD